MKDFKKYMDDVIRAKHLIGIDNPNVLIFCEKDEYTEWVRFLYSLKDSAEYSKNIFLPDSWNNIISIRYGSVAFIIIGMDGLEKI
jgi:hypothetical protein